MFDDDNGPWFRGDEIELPENDHPNVIPMEMLRDQAIALFGRFIAEQSGVNAETCAMLTEEKCKFLTLPETEAIVRSFSAMDNGEMMAVGGNSKAEAMQQIRKLMAALLERVLSNVIQEGVRRDLIDVAFDGEQNAFAFQVNANGERLIEEHKELFNDDV